MSVQRQDPSVMKGLPDSETGRRQIDSSSEPKLLARFASDRSGAISIAFGLFIMIMLFSIGGAVDFARWLHARTATISAVDAAVLAGARTLQTTGLDNTAAVAAAESFYASNVKERPTLKSDTVSFKVQDNNTAITAEGNAYIETTFLKLLNVYELPLLKLSGAEYSEAILSVGSNAEQSLEVSVMLDITGSMGGQKIIDMKAAAKDLVDILVWEDQSAHTSRVALVPFSASVYVGNALTGQATETGASSKYIQDRYGRSRRFYLATDCASERKGSEKYTDVVASGNDKVGYVYTKYGTCDSNQQIMPLTNDKAALHAKLDSLTAGGATAGHLGTAWAWYMLAPDWVTSLRAENHPEPYSRLTEMNGRGQPVLQKIAVLMTDGEYNVQYCTSGIRDRNSVGSSSQRGNCTAPNGRSRDQARSLCAAMKAKGITVYTVGFALAQGGDAYETMSQCATSSDHFYPAENGDELKQSFRDIALKISDIFLSK